MGRGGDALCGFEREHPELRQLFPEESQRRHFRRALVAPLYAPLVELGHLKERMKSRLMKLGAETALESSKACKDRGNQLFRRQQWDDAMTCYRQAVNALRSSAVSEGEAVDLELAAVCSNMALCCLKLKDHQEAVIADNAVKHLAKCGKEHQLGALAKKIWSRKAEGHKGLGQLADAEKAMQRVPT